MKKCMKRLTSLLLILSFLMVLFVPSISNAGQIIRQKEKTVKEFFLEKVGTTNENVDVDTDIETYINNKKAEFEELISGLEVEESSYSNLFSSEEGNYKYIKTSLELSDGTTEGMRIAFGNPTYGIENGVLIRITHANYYIYYTEVLVSKVAQNRYPDVLKDDWFYNSVEYVSVNGMMNGYTAGENAGKFGPNDEITRGQIVTILYRREGSPAVSGDWTFKDTGMYDYYRDAIKWAAQNGIVTGYTAGEDEGKFLPDNPITREQLAVILQRYAKFKNKSVTEKASLTTFGDYEAVSPWALEGLEWVVAKGIISGDLATNPPSINPQENATRAQAATMIMRFCNNV